MKKCISIYAVILFLLLLFCLIYSLVTGNTYALYKGFVGAAAVTLINIPIFIYKSIKKALAGRKEKKNYYVDILETELYLSKCNDIFTCAQDYRLNAVQEFCSVLYSIAKFTQANISNANHNEVLSCLLKAVSDFYSNPRAKDAVLNNASKYEYILKNNIAGSNDLSLRDEEVWSKTLKLIVDKYIERVIPQNKSFDMRNTEISQLSSVFEKSLQIKDEINELVIDFYKNIQIKLSQQPQSEIIGN